jgi:hypothetical protein
MAGFWSLPEAVRAREAANETPAGHLKWGYAVSGPGDQVLGPVVQVEEA